MELNWKIILIIFIISTALPLSDLSHHLRISYLYNKMIRTGEIITTDPQLHFKESLFTYGVPAYILSGLTWFLFGKFSIDLLICLFFIISGFAINKLFKNNSTKILASVIFLFNSLNDSYIAVFTITLFWLSLLLYKKGSKFYSIPLIISTLSYPYTMIASLYFVFKDKKHLIWWIPGLVYFGLMTIIFGSETHLTYLNFLRLFSANTIMRLFSLYAPFFKKRLLKIISFLFLFGLLIEVPLYALNYNSFNSLFEITFGNYLEDFPEINGYLRVVDYYNYPILAQLHKINATLYQGIFFESNLLCSNIYTKWKKQDYYSFLKTNNISHVLSGNKKIYLTNELNFLNESMKEWSNEYYTLYKTPN